MEKEKYKKSTFNLFMINKIVIKKKKKLVFIGNFRKKLLILKMKISIAVRIKFGEKNRNVWYFNATSMFIFIT